MAHWIHGEYIGYTVKNEEITHDLPKVITRIKEELFNT